MSSEGKYRLIRYVGYAIEILALFVLQETPHLLPQVFGARPVLLIPVALAISMFEPETPSLAFGLVCGLFIDFGFGRLLGFHALLLAALCYVISLVTANLFQNNFLSAMLFTLLAAVSLFLLHWFFFFVLYGYEYPVYALTAHYLPMFVYTVVIMPIVYYFNRALALQVRSKEE